MSAMTEKLDAAGIDTLGARLTMVCIEAIRQHPGSVVDAWRFVGATFGHEFVRGLMNDMQGNIPVPKCAQGLRPDDSVRVLSSTAYKPRVIPPERLERRRALREVVRTKFGYKMGDGRDIAQVGVHELDSIDRDGALVRAVKARIGILTNEDRFKDVCEVMTQKQFNEVLDQVRQHPIKVICK